MKNSIIFEDEYTKLDLDGDCENCELADRCYGFCMKWFNEDLLDNRKINYEVY